MWKNSSFCANFYLNELRYVSEDRILYQCVFLCATVCVLEILQKLCHLVIHLLIISHTVREKKCSLFSLTRFKLNQKCNFFDLV